MYFLIRYQINARTELAVRYNDISPLENHHCAVTFQILSMPECNVFANIEPESFKQIRQVQIQHLQAWVTCDIEQDPKPIFDLNCRQSLVSFWGRIWRDMERYWTPSNRKWTTLTLPMRSTSNVYVFPNFSIGLRLRLGLSSKYILYFYVFTAKDGLDQVLWHLEWGQTHWGGRAMGGLFAGGILYPGT